jgi:signal transduction histidine kinase
VRLPRTAAARLALAIAGAIALALCSLFASFYLLVRADLGSRTDRFLLDKAKEFESLARQGGVAGLGGEFDREAQATGTRIALYRLLAADGRVLAGSSDAAFAGIDDGPAPLPDPAAGRPLLRTRALSGRRYHARECLLRLDAGDVLQLVHYTGDDEALLADLRRSFGVTLAVALAGAALAGRALSRRALAGVEEVTRTAQAIAGGTFERRVPLLGRGEEIDRLASTFNAMLDRISAVMAELRQVSDDIAHDLRIPIARIRGQAELALTGRSAPEDPAALAQSVVEECDRLLAMVNTMLDLAEAEAGVPVERRQPVSLGGLVREACELYLPVAEEKGVTLTAEVGGEVALRADAGRLRRILANLLDNAVKYTPPSGRVSVALEAYGSRAAVHVADSGPGIAPEDLGRVFDRFFRGDGSRGTPGSGLGLSLARALARNLGGDLTVTSRPGEGSVFSLVLPLPGATEPAG